jgi:hypothetical protein
MRKAPLGNLKAALGCGIVFILFSGILLCLLVIVAMKIVRMDAD